MLSSWFDNIEFGEKGMGDVGKTLLDQLKDPNTEIGRSLKRLESMEIEIKNVMTQLKFDPELAKQANAIFSKSPEGMEALSEEDQKTIKDYWVKKKSCIVVLLQKGYTPEELFS